MQDQYLKLVIIRTDMDEAKVMSKPGLLLLKQYH